MSFSLLRQPDLGPKTSRENYADSSMSSMMPPIGSCRLGVEGWTRYPANRAWTSLPDSNLRPTPNPQGRSLTLVAGMLAG